jgi:signal transduction histidine kinase
MQPKILIVDDREDNLLSMETILEPEGYKTVRANSGTNALKILLNEYDFALILMDVKMPNLNGFETASLIYEREKLRHIPIIFITANNYGEENVFKGYKAGAVDYVYKPVNPELLKAKVAVFIDLYKKTHQLIAQEQRLIAINRSLENEIREKKISEEKILELNKKLIENITRLESANQELDRFAFMASHDLQEPLRKIRLFSDRLFYKYNDKLDEEAISFINRIQQSGMRMENLIKDILTFSKLSIDKDPFVETDLNLILEEVLVEMNEEVQKKSAKINIGPMPKLPVNPGLMRPLFYNLINNSLKYSKKDVPPTIKIRSEYNKDRLLKESNFCRIIIEDNGIGFDQQYAEQIFGMFKRLHRHNEFEGTGIGLALCKKIVEEHRGHITALSRENEGATFIISLPTELVPG